MIPLKDANRITNSAGPDQTAPLCLHCLISVRKLRKKIMVTESLYFPATGYISLPQDL